MTALISGISDAGPRRPVIDAPDSISVAYGAAWVARYPSRPNLQQITRYLLADRAALLKKRASRN